MSPLSAPSPFIRFVLLLFVAMIGPTRGAVINKPFRNETLVESLNQFVLSVDHGFRSIAGSLEAIKQEMTKEHESITKLRNAATSDITKETSNAYSLNQIIVSIRKLNTSILTLKTIEKSLKYAKCPDSWRTHAGRCFQFYNCTNKCTANIAKTQCEGKNAHLARVLTQQDQELFTETLKFKFIILGGNDKDTEGIWVWADGTLIKSGYNNWNNGDPEGGRSENCLNIDKSSKKWFSFSCTASWDKMAYVCERPALV